MSLVNGQIRALAERVAASHGLDVVDVEFAGGGGKHRTLRVFLERNAAGRAVLEQRLAAMRAERGPDAEFAAETGAAAGGGTFDPDFDAGQDASPEANQADADDLGADDLGVDDFGADDGEPLESSGIELDLVEAGEVAGLSPEEDELAYLREVPDGVPVEQLSGITHGDCARFSQDFGMALDVEELVAGTEYLLEASSPGLDRKLAKREEFLRFAGLLCKVQTFTPIDGNRHWQGHLGPVHGDVLQLVPVAPKGGKKKARAAEKPVEIALGNIEKAQLVPEF